MGKHELYSTKLVKDDRAYFFDILQSEQGKLYLKILESKKTKPASTFTG